TVERWFAPDFIASGKAEPVRAMTAEVSLEGYRACAGALQNYDFSHVLPRITVPTLLIAGANDGNMPQSMRIFADTITGACFEIIAQAGHIPNFEQPERFNRVLTTFLDSTA